GRPQTPGELAGRTLAPEVGEVKGRLLANHVVMQGDDVDVRLAQGAKNRLDLLGGHDEIAINDGVFIAAGEGCPGGQAHRATDLDAVHRPVAADRDLNHPVLRLALVPENLVDCRGRELIRLRSETLKRWARLGLGSPDLLDGVPD